MEPQPALSGVGTVVSGEASESDEEDVNLPLNLHLSLHGIISQLVYNASIFTTRSELRKVLVLFSAQCATLFVCESNISQAAEPICAKFTRKTCLVRSLTRTSLDVKGKGQGH